ncbi:hypothetical protein R3I93_004317 [Phoxinus phoxinus]
MLQETR